MLLIYDSSFLREKILCKIYKSNEIFKEEIEGIFKKDLLSIKKITFKLWESKLSKN